MHLSIGGFELIARKAPANLRPFDRSTGRGGWGPIVHEPFMGAWQQNVELSVDTSLSCSAVFACVTQIATDIAKMHLRLVEQDAEGIWHETENPAWSPVLRKPNRYQTIGQFVEQWMTSKLVYGNTYVLKERDLRGVVRALYVLDPRRVTPLVAPDGAVYYELRRDDLAGLASIGTGNLVVPSHEIIHDLMNALFHPLVGVAPLYACGLSALQALTIQSTSNKFFAAGSKPSGILTAPGAVDKASLARLKEDWEANFTGSNAGRVAVVSDGLKYEALTVTAADAQLIEQLKWTSENICTCYHVPPYMIGVGPPPFASVEPILQQYHAQCIQSLTTAFELKLDEGLGLAGTDFGTEFDLDDLIWMDTATKTKAAADAIGSGAMAPNEARRKYFGLGSVQGGDSPYLQQQNFSLKALDERDSNKPFAKPAAPPTAAPATELDDEDDEEPVAPTKHLRTGTLALALLRKDWSGLSDGV